MNNSDTPQGLNMSAWLSAMDETVAALYALSELVVTAMDHGDDMQRCAYGIGTLFREQFDDAKEMLSDMRIAAFSKKGPAEPVDMQIGQNMVMRRHANGDVLMVPRSDFEGTSAEENKIVADKLQRGFDAGQIAQAVNLKTETVERVIAQMLATTLEADEEDGSSDRAVNQ